MIASLETIAARAYSTMHTIKASYSAGLHIQTFSVPGCIVECGVAAGANAAAMATVNAMSAVTPWRPVHLFDTFAGIPQAGPEDVEFLKAGHPPGLAAHSRRQVEFHLVGWGFNPKQFVFHEGMFQDTVPEWAKTNPKIALLRLDGDLYESTKVCLEYLVPLVVPGGIIIIDDFDLSGCRKATLDYMGNRFGPIQFIKH
jgi:O-methyltransferase